MLLLAPGSPKRWPAPPALGPRRPKRRPSRPSSRETRRASARWCLRTRSRCRRGGHQDRAREAAWASFRGPEETSDHRRFGDGHDESSSPAACVGELGYDLVFEVPGENEDEIRLLLVEVLGRVDWDMRARQEPPVLVRIAV